MPEQPAEPGTDFYEPGRTYLISGHLWRFRCDVITTHPVDDERTALGWRFHLGEWGPCAYGEDDWASDRDHLETEQ